MKMNFVVWSSLLLITTSQISAQTVSTKAPKDYTTEVAPLLTPLEKALETAGEPPKEAEHGWIILDETVHHIRPDGSRLLVTHQISRAISQNGAENCGRDVTSYRLSSQKPHLVLARSIQPDGRRQEVRPDARFLQTPQREADYDLYNDSGELVLIFPNVKPGTLTEYIVVLEDSRPRIPGHYTSYFGFQFGWPAALRRATADMPGDYAERMTTTPLGRGVPEARKEALPKGRQRWTWEVTRTKSSQGEEAGAPFDQRGPLVRLTTLKDWKEFVDWYRPLVEKRFVLGEKLEAEVTRWTEKAASPQDILQILHAHAANDVRYVGLEFGTCDIEPHPAAEVWEHQYGDCKDKASLLAAMLRFKGISAHLVLVNTEHLGRVERRSPDYRDFSHAILVAELPDGPVFCDPTIEGSAPGMLTPSDADRDVLVISSPERWMRTPPQDAGTYALNFDAKLSATGELSGWATLETKGYYANYFRNLEARSTRQQLKERLQRDIGNTWQGASVIDLKTEEAKAGDLGHRIHAYFIVPANGSPALRFPFNSGLLPDLGDGDKRETDAFVWRDTNATTSVITLPPGFRAASVPAPLTVTHEHGQGSARWNLDGGRLRAVLSYQTKSSRLPAKEVKPFMQSVNTLRAWLDKPVTLEAEEEGAPASPTPADPLADFPRMPTGEGQLQLVEERHPTGGDLKLRRAALERTLEFFPQDEKTQFSARTQIAYVDQMEDKHDASIRRLRTVLESQQGQVTLESRALAEYLLARGLNLSKQAEAAKPLLQALTQNKQVSTFRRAWSHSMLSDILAEGEPEKALTEALAGLALADGDVGGLLRRVCLLRAQLGDEKGLAADVEKFAAGETPQTEDHLAGVAAAADELAPEKPAQAALLVAALERTGKDGRFGAEFDKKVAAARVRVEAQQSLGKVREHLQAWAKAHPQDLPQWKVPDTLKTAEDFSEALAKADKRADASAAEKTTLAVEALLRFEPGPWYAERLWHAAFYAELDELKQVPKAPPPLLVELLDRCDTLPPLSEAALEGAFLRAKMLRRRGQFQEEAVVLRGLRTRQGLDPSYIIGVLEQLGNNAVARADVAEALDVWGQARTVSSYYLAPTLLLQGVLLALETGHEKEALALVNDLRGVEESVIAKSRAADNIRLFLEFAKDEEAMRRWWQATAQWWPKWQALEAANLPKRATDAPLVPVIPHREKFGEEYGEHLRAGRQAEMMEMFRRLAHAARWQPFMASEVVSFAGSNIPAASLQQPFREVVTAMHEAGSFTDPAQAAKVLMWAMVVWVDGSRPKAALAPGRAHHQKHGAKEVVDIAILRLWAMAAERTGEDVAETIRALEQHLAAPEPVQERFRSVNILASLYRKAGQRDQEQALLTRELASPLNKDTAEEHMQPMRMRLEVLQDGGDAGDAPAKAVQAWLAVHKPAWYDHVRPLDLKDEKAADADEAMMPGNPKALPAPQAAKLCCLVAADAEQPAQRRIAAIGFLGWYIPVIAADSAQMERWLQSLADEKGLPRPARALPVWMAAAHCLDRNMHAALTKTLAHPILEHVMPAQQKMLAQMRRYAEVGEHDLEGSDRLAGELLKDVLDPLALDCLQRCIARLALGGRPEQARKHYQAMAAARYAEDAAPQKGARQLAALKAINTAQKLAPLQDALRDWFLASPLAQAAPATPQVREPLHPMQADVLPPEEQLQLYRQRLHAGTWPRGDLGAWMDLIKSLPKDKHQVEQALGLLAVALEKAPGDDIRAELIGRAAFMVDVDDPPTLEALEKVLKPWRARLDAPETQDALRMHDLFIRIRSGRDGDLFAALQSMQNPGRKAYVTHRILIAFISRGDKTAVRRVLDMTDPSLLLNRSIITHAREAYLLLGMQDEAELATDQMRRFMEDDMLTCWTQPVGDQVRMLLYMALHLGNADAIPRPFNAHMLATLRNPYDRLGVQVLDALLRKDWEQAATAAAEGTRLFPTYYDFYYYLGTACAELGRKDEAVKALTTFLKFDHNTIEAARAQQRLDKIQNPAGG